jgi:hypothetical protein
MQCLDNRLTYNTIITLDRAASKQTIHGILTLHLQRHFSTVINNIAFDYFTLPKTTANKRPLLVFACLKAQGLDYSQRVITTSFALALTQHIKQVLSLGAFCLIDKDICWLWVLAPNKIYYARTCSTLDQHEQQHTMLSYLNTHYAIAITSVTCLTQSQLTACLNKKSQKTALPIINLAPWRKKKAQTRAYACIIIFSLAFISLSIFSSIHIQLLTKEQVSANNHVLQLKANIAQYARKNQRIKKALHWQALINTIYKMNHITKEQKMLLTLLTTFHQHTKAFHLNWQQDLWQAQLKLATTWQIQALQKQLKHLDTTHTIELTKITKVPTGIQATLKGKQ